MSKKPDYEAFGRRVFRMLRDNEDFFGAEFSEDIMPIAVDCGLAIWTTYDPALHGDNIEADPGDEIWYWLEE